MTTHDPTNHQTLVDATITWINSLLDSASSDVIGVANWWDRATSALVTAAAGASTIGEATTIAARKLQIESTSPGSDATLLEASKVIAADFAGWQRIVDTEAVYLIALARVARKTRRKAA